MRTFLSMSSARSQASALDTLRWRTIPSAIWSPIAKAGLSEVIGSWKIIAMRSPRMRSISASGSASRSRPRYSTRPPAIFPGGSISRRIDSAVTVLPEPDSPTMPSTRPADSVKDSPSTAFSTRPALAKWVRSSSTARRASLTVPPARSAPRLGVERLAQPVADEVEGEGDEDDDQAGEDGDVRRLAQHHPSVAHHDAPVGRRRLHPEAEEAQARADDDHQADQGGGVDQHRRDHVGEDVADDDRRLAGAAGARRFDIGLLLDLQGRGAGDARDVGHQHDHDGDDLGRDAGLQHAGDGDGEQHQREGEQDVERAHDRLVDHAAEIA